VNAEQFLKIVDQGDQPIREQVNQLYKLHENFPYFQIPNVLLAKHEAQKGKENQSEFLAWAAINSPNRSWLKKLIEDPLIISKVCRYAQTSSEIKTSPLQVFEDSYKALIPKPTLEQNLDGISDNLKILEENLRANLSTEEKVSQADKDVKISKRKRSGSDDLIEQIKRKEKKEILDEKKKEQIDIIKSFSKREIKLATIKELENFQKQSDLSENSTQLNPNLLSESYAKLLAKQGKNKKAKEIYQKLMVKFPNKSTYFANLIKELEDKS
jgi:hypothetical protein